MTNEQLVRSFLPEAVLSEDESKGGMKLVNYWVSFEGKQVAPCSRDKETAYQYALESFQKVLRAALTSESNG